MARTKASRFAFLAVILLASSFILLLPAAPAKASAIVKVDVWEQGSMLYNPQGVTINVGDTVMWYDYDDYGHTVTSYPNQAESWNSGPLTETITFTHTFTHAGNFTYYSTIPEDVGFTGWVYVQQPVPEFPGMSLWFTLMASLGVALAVSSRLSPRRMISAA